MPRRFPLIVEGILARKLVLRTSRVSLLRGYLAHDDKMLKMQNGLLLVASLSLEKDMAEFNFFFGQNLHKPLQARLKHCTTSALLGLPPQSYQKRD